MTETYKVLSGIYDTNVSPRIPIISEYATRGNSLKIVNCRSHYNLRKYSFCFRITNVWNSLPFSVITTPLVNSFKNRLDISLGITRTGKQNYQDLGTEAELSFEFFKFYHSIFNLNTIRA